MKSRKEMVRRIDPYRKPDRARECSEKKQECENAQKKAKNLLTRKGVRGIIFKRSKNGVLREGPRGRGNLENDTDKREKRQLILK